MILHPIYYACKAQNATKNNYTIIELKLLKVVFVFEKFRSYLLGTKVIVQTYHLKLQYFMEK